MSRSLLLACLAVVTACGEVPTQPSLDTPPVAMARPEFAKAASVERIDLEYSGCEVDPFMPELEVCIQQSGQLVIVENAGGVTSFSVQGAELYAEFFFEGELVQTQTLTDRIHELFRDGEEIQYSQRLCIELGFGDFSFQFGFLVNRANGEQKHFKFSTRGCQL